MHKILRAESGLPPFLAEPAHMRSKTRILLRTLTVTALMLGAARPLSSQEFTPPVPLLEMTGHRGVVRFLQYLPPDGRNILSLSGHSLIVWDSKSGEEVIRLADGEPIFSFAAAGDRVYVATSSSARILDTSTAEVVLEFDPQQRPRLRWACLVPRRGPYRVTRTRSCECLGFSKRRVAAQLWGTFHYHPVSRPLVA